MINVIVCKLTDTDSLIFRTPTTPLYSPDEIEIWLIGTNSQLCIFKDSYYSVFLCESSHVIQSFRNHNNRYEPEELLDRYSKHCFGDSYDDQVWDYVLFSYGQYDTFLSEAPDGNAVITIVNIYPTGGLGQINIAHSYQVNREYLLGKFDELLKLPVDGMYEK